MTYISILVILFIFTFLLFIPTLPCAAIAPYRVITSIFTMVRAGIVHVYNLAAAYLTICMWAVKYQRGTPFSSKPSTKTIVCIKYYAVSLGSTQLIQGEGSGVTSPYSWASSTSMK